MYIYIYIHIYTHPGRPIVWQTTYYWSTGHPSIPIVWAPGKALQPEIDMNILKKTITGALHLWGAAEERAFVFFNMFISISGFRAFSGPQTIGVLGCPVDQ